MVRKVKTKSKQQPIPKRSDAIVTIPKQVSSQPEYSSRTTFKWSSKAILTSAAGMYYFGNKKILATLYQNYNGATSVIAGLSTYSAQYVAYLIEGMRVKCTFTNTLTQPVQVGMYPTSVNTADDQTTLQPGFRLPQCKSLVLGGYQSGTSTAPLSIVVDNTKLLGYSVINNVGSLLTLFGSNPSTGTYAQILFQSLDASTVPALEVVFEVEIDARMITRKEILS